MPRTPLDRRRPAATPGRRSATPLRLVGPVAPPRLADRLDAALAGRRSDLEALHGAAPVDTRDAALTLLAIHDLPAEPVADHGHGPAGRRHPALVDLTWRLEGEFLERVQEADEARRWVLPDDPSVAIRAVAAAGRVPAMYRWLAAVAEPEDVRAFLELEGGPEGAPGDGAELHAAMEGALRLRRTERTELPTACLDRPLLRSTLATNPWFHPETLGALGLIELRAGARARRVVTALRRTGAPPAALDFHAARARTGRQRARGWMDQVVCPLVDERPELGWRIVRGARWQWAVDARFHEGARGLLYAAPVPTDPAGVDPWADGAAPARPRLRLLSPG